MSQLSVDVLMVARCDRAIDRRVIRGLEAQGLEVRLHVLPNAVSTDATERLQLIVEGRNLLRSVPSSPFALWLDSDIVLRPLSVLRLAESLVNDAGLGGCGAYYGDSDPTGLHVGMGALLCKSFLVRETPVRWEPGRCECSCYASDLRAKGYDVRYDKSVRARHL